MERNQSLREEIANSVSHGIGALAGMAITPVLIIMAVPSGASAITGVSIFAATITILYLSSSLYHAFPHGKTKRVFRVFDHIAIFLLIAGSYTPFTLGALNAPWGWALFGITWAFALGGVLLKILQPVNSGKLSMALYLGMGWIAVFAVKPLIEALPSFALIGLIAGGVMYTLGIFFFAYDHRVKYHHFIWHLFVLAGTTCHVIAVMGLYIGTPTTI